jgi:hypothetical protein
MCFGGAGSNVYYADALEDGPAGREDGDRTFTGSYTGSRSCPFSSSMIVFSKGFVHGLAAPWTRVYILLFARYLVRWMATGAEFGSLLYGLLPSYYRLYDSAPGVETDVRGAALGRGSNFTFYLASYVRAAVNP